MSALTSAVDRGSTASAGRLASRIFKSRVGQTSGALILSQVLLGVSGLIAARALGPSGRGEVAGIIAWMGFIPALALLGMNTALAVRVAERADQLGRACATAVVYTALVGVPVAAIAAIVVPDVLGGLGAHAASVARWAVPSGVILAMLSEMMLAMTVARRRYFIFNGCRILLPLIPLVVVASFALCGALSPTVVVVATVGASAASLAWLIVSMPWRGARFDPGAFRADLRFGAVSAVSGWAGLANWRVDFLLLSAFASASQLGYYGVANNVMLPVLTIPTAAATVLVPRVAALFERESATREQTSLIAQVAKRYVALSVAGGILLAVLAPLAIPFLFGTSFRPAVTLVWILIPGFVGRAAVAIIASGATAMRRPGIGNAAELVALVVTAALLAALLPSYGAVGAAIASTSAYLTSAAVAAFALLRVSRSALSGS